MTHSDSTVITLSTGKKLSILPATHGLSIVRAGLVLEAERKWESLHPETEGGETPSVTQNLLRYDYTYLYPTLRACTEGKAIPDYKEFSNMSETDAQLWIATVGKVNPHWLPEEVEQTAVPEDIQKKDVELTASIQESNGS